MFNIFGMSCGQYHVPANKMEAMAEIGVKIFKLFAAARFENSNSAKIINKAMRIPRIVPAGRHPPTDVSYLVSRPSSFVSRWSRDEDSQPSKMTTAVKNTIINVPKNNLYLSITLQTPDARLKTHDSRFWSVVFGL